LACHLSSSPDGNQVKGTCDAVGNLPSATDETGIYARHPFERLVFETAGTTNHLFDVPNVIQESVGTSSTHHTRGLGDRILNRRAGTALRYYHHDAMGSVVGLPDNTGSWWHVRW
jgi:hypothetical protein